MANQPLTFTALTNIFIRISQTTTSLEPYEFSKDGLNWVQNEISLAAGETCIVRGNHYPLSKQKFEVSGNFSLDGSISSLVDNGVGGPITITGVDHAFEHVFSQNTGLKEVSKNLFSNISWDSSIWNAFAYMFYGCSGLTTLPENLLPKTTLSKGCYSCMFWGTGITNLPNNFLPATNLEEFCYSGMFNSCNGLTVLPKDLLPAESLCNGCYVSMFYSCTNLKEIYVHFKDWGSESTSSWLNGTSSVGTFYCPSKLSVQRGEDFIPNGWEVKILKEKGPGSVTFLNKKRIGGQLV